MSTDDKKPLSFGFSKKRKETKVLENVNGVGLGLGLSDETFSSGGVNEHDLITSLEGKKVISVVPKEEPRELVIPLIKRNTWSLGSEIAKKQKHNSKTRPQSSSEAKPTGSSGLDDAAIQEIISDSAKQNLEWEDRGNEDMGMTIPLLMQNKVPEGFETDDKLDVSIRPDEATDADYDQVPISQFGIAMLRGMGWKEGEGIGRKTEAVKMLEPKPRPKGQGLGAAPKPPELSTKPKRPLKPGETRVEETPIGYAKGVGIVATKGAHKNMYGRIEGVDEDNAQLIIKLAIGGQIVTISQHIANIVDEDEYKRNAKDLSRLSKCKQNVEQNNEDNYLSKKEEENKYKEKSKRQRDEDDHHRKRKKHKEKYKEETYRDRKSERRQRGSEERRDYREKDKHQNKEKEPKKSLEQHWLQPDLRVRFIDKFHKQGKYYMSKVKIEDVVTPEQCTCKTDNGHLIYDILESMLETVIPKTDPGYVMVVLGKYKGQLGIIIKKHKSRHKADIQLLQDRDTIVHLNYEEICEYVGDIHSNEDF